MDGLSTNHPKPSSRELVSASSEYNISIDAGRMDGDTYTAMVSEGVSQLCFWAPPQEGASMMEASGPGGRERCKALTFEKKSMKMC